MHDLQLTRVSSPDLPTALNDPLNVLRDAVASLEAGLGGDVQVRSITSSLISTWHLIERDPGFEVAAADLLAAARQLASPVRAPAPARLQRLLREAQTRLHERLASARVVSACTSAAPIDAACYASQSVAQTARASADMPPAMPHKEAVLDGITSAEDGAADIAALARSLAPRMAA